MGRPRRHHDGMRRLAVILAALVFAAPAGAALRAGDRASIDVSVATLWKAPDVYRALDRPSVTNPVDLAAWNRNLSTTASRAWLDSHVQTQALYGQEVVVLERSGAWAKVAVVDEPDPQDPHGYPGWLRVAQLAPDFDRSGAQVVVTSRTSQLRVHGRTIPVSYGTTLPLERWSGDSAVVRTPDGIGTAAGVAPALKPSAAAVVSEARRFVGLHYLWGGLSAWGFDCSGLVWDVFRVQGMVVPRDADPQFQHGTPVARSALRPGDLLFWGSKHYADHVAIYAGGGRMVEAPDSAHSVRVVPVRWDAFYLGARRYLGG
jgi:gamma-D-glutamyl-L-lysine dipeptidyl-peptidase